MLKPNYSYYSSKNAQKHDQPNSTTWWRIFLEILSAKRSLWKVSGVEALVRIAANWSWVGRFSTRSWNSRIMWNNIDVLGSLVEFGIVNDSNSRLVTGKKSSMFRSRKPQVKPKTPRPHHFFTRKRSCHIFELRCGRSCAGLFAAEPKGCSVRCWGKLYSHSDSCDHRGHPRSWHRCRLWANDSHLKQESNKLRAKWVVPRKYLRIRFTAIQLVLRKLLAYCGVCIWLPFPLPVQFK